MGTFIGIDLGTTFSAVAYIDETGRPTIIRNEDGQNITPSCVRLTPDGHVEVGESARRELGMEGSSAAGRFKLDMHIKDKTWNLAGTELGPAELSAQVLTELKRFTENAVGAIEDAVVTVPANFPNEAREATTAAAEAADLSIKFVINEPTAAAMYYAFKESKHLAGVYAVYDLGGGTFDISIVEIQDQNVKVLTTNGIARLGGNDFDEALLKLVKQKYEEANGEGFDTEDFHLNEAEELKKTLTRRDSAKARVLRTNITVTRAEFDEAISTMIAQTEFQCEASIEEAEVALDDIQGVMLVGGSTRVPAVVESIKKVFVDKELISTVNPDEVVALGAALYAAYKGDHSKLSAAQRQSVSKIKFSEVASHCWGTFALAFNEARNEHEIINEVMIKKNARLPATHHARFYTIAEGQDKLKCTVTQSTAPETDRRFVQVQAERYFELPPDLPSEEEIDITFNLTEDGKGRATFAHLASNTQVTLDFYSGPRPAEMTTFPVE